MCMCIVPLTWEWLHWDILGTRAPTYQIKHANWYVDTRAGNQKLSQYSHNRNTCLHRTNIGLSSNLDYGVAIRYWLLRSAVGKTHDLQSDLWWTIPLCLLLDRFGIPFGFHTIKSALARHSGVKVPSRQRSHVVNFDQSISYMGCALAFVLQVRSLYVPCRMVHFQGSISGSP